MDNNLRDDYLIILKAIFDAFDIKPTIWDSKYKPEHLEYIHGLYLKFIYHCSSIFNLQSEIKLPWIPNTFLDPASIEILCRANFEIVIITNYIFLDAETQDDFELRFYAWKLSSWIGQESYPFETMEARRNALRLKITNDKLREIIKNNSSFKKLKPREQKAILYKDSKWKIPEVHSDGSSHPPSNKELAQRVGFNKTYSNIPYQFTSKYIHPTSISVDQIHAVKSTDEKMNNLTKNSIESVICYMTIMLDMYNTIFPESKSIYKHNSELRRKVEFYKSLGTE